MNFLQIINKIIEISGTNDKISFLKFYKNDEELTYLLKVAFDPFIITHIKKLDYNPNTFSTDNNFNEFKQIVEKLKKSNINDFLRKEVKQFLESTEYEFAELYHTVLTKNLRIGMNAKNINKAYDYNLINIFNVMLADKDTTKIKNFPVQVELKLDGVRCIIFNTDEQTIAYTRNGKELYLPKHLDHIKENYPKGVYDGELISVPDRVNTTAICNRLIKKPENVEINKINLQYHCFDYISLEDFFDDENKQKQYNRTLKVHEIIGKGTDDIFPVQSKTCNNMKEITEVYDKYRQQKMEGIIIKNINGLYEKKRSKNWIKMKAINTASLKVIDYYEGKNKYSGMIGGFIAETKDGIKVEIGSGLLDSERSKDPNKFIGKIIEIEYNEIQKDQEGKQFFFLPIYKSIREDKEVPDTLEEILKEMK